MRWPIIFAALMLTGCPAAMLVSATVNEPQRGYVHPPNAKDYESWIGEPKTQIETHSQFSLLPREVRTISDGSEMWTLRFCPRKTSGYEDCCLYQFVIKSNVVASYRTAGTCRVDCSMRPETKVQACINAAVVPDGYK